MSYRSSAYYEPYRFRKSKIPNPKLLVQEYDNIIKEAQNDCFNNSNLVNIQDIDIHNRTLSPRRILEENH